MSNKRSFTQRSDIEFSPDRAVGCSCCEIGDGPDGVRIYRLRFDPVDASGPRTLTAEFCIDGTDCFCVLDCRRTDRAKCWGGAERTARLAADMPLLQLISASDRNRYLFALGDVKTPTKIRLSWDIASRRQKVNITFFCEDIAPGAGYECLLRADTRDVDYCDALDDVKKWYSSLGYAPARTPGAALLPVYSTWYSYLTRLTAADVLRECREAAKLGFGAVIIDDGWQRADGSSVYGYCGDVRPFSGKFPDMRALVDELHSLGMKVALWYAVPYIGRFSGNYGRFEGRYLRDVPGCDCSVLDPRYPETRRFITDTYVRAAKEWNLDGFKLDFIDRFEPNGEIRDGMDFASVGDATEKLLSDVNAALTALKPDMMIEFRQPYTGPLIGAYANMLRVWDCPNDPLTNRLASVNMRLTTGAAVHSDPVYWQKYESVSSVALSLWGVLFAVPQISVRLDEISQEQRAVLARFLSFREAHIDTLASGVFRAANPAASYSYLSARSDKELIITASAESRFDLDTDRDCYLVNLTPSDTLAVKTRQGSRIEITDVFGADIGSFISDGQYAQIKVPTGGMASVKKSPST